MTAAARPPLAIALYPQVEHLWDIPLLIVSWDLGYRMEIRGRARGGFDNVLDAFPECG